MTKGISSGHCRHVFKSLFFFAYCWDALADRQVRIWRGKPWDEERQKATKIYNEKNLLWCLWQTVNVSDKMFKWSLVRGRNLCSEHRNCLSAKIDNWKWKATKKKKKMGGGKQSYGKSRVWCFSQQKDISETGPGQDWNMHEWGLPVLVQLINQITEIISFLIWVLDMLFSACWSDLHLLLNVMW